MSFSHRSVRVLSLLSLVAALAFAPGCELATHFGDFQAGSDTGASDGGGADGGGHDAGVDAAVDANVDANLPDSGLDGGNDASHDAAVAMHTVTVTISGTGMGTLTTSDTTHTCTSATSPCSWDVPEGTLTVESSPDATSTLASWDGACTGTAIGSASCTIDVTADVALGATYDVRHVTLDVGVSGVGTVTSTSPATLGIDCSGSTTGCSATVDSGTSVTLHANPGAGYDFTGWNLASCTTTGDCTFTIIDDTHVDATFTDGRVAVRVALSGDGSGSVAADSGAISCGTTCSDIYVPGTHVVLTATPTLGTDFTSWTNCPTTPSGTTCAFDVPATGTTLPTITATFTLQRFTVTIHKSGSGTGTVTGAAGAINCGTGAGCIDANVPYGTTITLSAATSVDSNFAGWAGVSGCGAATSCMLTVTGDITATATFTLKTVHVTFTGTGTGSGTLTTDDGLVNCTIAAGTASGTCAADYTIHTPITVRRSAAVGSSFVVWGSSPGGYCSGSAAQCDFTAEEDLGVTAQFNLSHYDLGLTVTGTVASGMTGMGSVAISPATMTPCASSVAPGTTCTNNYAYNTMVTLTATAGGTSVFTGWGGDCSSAGSAMTCMVTMAAARNVSAAFAPNVASLNVTTSGTTQGTVAGGAINCGSTCSAVVTSGTMVTLTATANTANGYVFSSWGGACASAGSNSMCTVTISGVTNVSATFALATRTIDVTVTGPAGGGVVTDGSGHSCASGTCSQSYPFGSMVTLTATPNSGYTFAGWTNCPLVAGTTCTYASLTANQTVSAAFAVSNVTIGLTLGGTGGGAVTGNGFNCHSPSIAGDVCTVTVPSGTAMSLTATPGVGSTQGAWGGPCTGNGSTCAFTATSSVPSITKDFTLQQYTLTVALSPTTPPGGTVVSTQPASPVISCGSACSRTFDYNTVVRLSETPNAGFRFGGWSVSTCGTNTTCDVTMTSAQTVTATFVPVRTLSVSIPGSSTVSYIRSATVSSTSPAGLNCQNSAGTSTVTCTAEFDVGASIALSAQDVSYRFYGATSWVFSGTGASTFCGGSGAPYSPECTFTMPPGAGNLNLTVTFGQLGNIAFLSDNTYTPGSAPFIGFGQADLACKNEATAAGLPGNAYIALLSGGTTSSAFATRIGGLTPAPSGWVRPDGRPVASSLAQLESGALIHPIMLTPMGMMLPGAQFWSNTTDGGAFASTNSCSSWGASSGMARLGHAGRTTFWADDSGDTVVGCTVPRRLVCLQTDGGSFSSVRAPSPPAGAARVFTTVGVRGGDQGLAGMDALCASEASAASLPGTYLAFVSSSSGTASSRTTLSGPLVRTDGWTIGPMNAWTGGTSSPIGTFGVNASGTPIQATSSWTGMPGGSGAGGTAGACADWTSSTMTGNAGFPASAQVPEWAAISTSAGCTRTLPIMCIQR